MAKQTVPVSDLDSPCKEALDYFLPRFLSFFFPHIHEGISWKRGYEALDKEFQQIVREAAAGEVLADKLYKVWCKDGQETWLLIHIEIQGGFERGFARRMFDYNVRALQLHNRMVVSLAVLCDDRPNWRPDRFSQEAWGCELSLRFPVVKLLDYAGDLEALERHDNPFAQVVLAHLKAQETRQEPANRYAWKVRLVRGLYERGWTAEDVGQLFRLLDWLMALPEGLPGQFREELYRYEEERRMPYVTSIERMAKEEGLREGLLEAVAMGLECKFGEPGLALMPRIREWKSVTKLQALTEAIRKASTLGEIRKRVR
jgi:hypothetical protein